MKGKHTILIVDDTPANVKTLATILKDDYRIVVATSGEEALSVLSGGESPDVILLDIVMPGMDGYEVCKRLKAGESTREIPVIFITAKSDEESRRKSSALDAAAFITKPFDAMTVLQVVKTHLWLVHGE
jgi:putative two-component system response regulator